MSDFIIDVSRQNRCPICGSMSIVYDEAAGHYVCTNCGYTIEGVVFDTVVGFDKDGKRVRTGQTETITHHRTVGTQLPFEGGKGVRRDIVKKLNKGMKQTLFMNKDESEIGDMKRGIEMMISTIDELTEFGIPPVPKYIVETAHSITKTVHDMIKAKRNSKRKIRQDDARDYGAALVLVLLDLDENYVPSELILDYMERKLNIKANAERLKRVKSEIKEIVIKALREKRGVDVKVDDKKKALAVFRFIMDVIGPPPLQTRALELFEMMYEKAERAGIKDGRGLTALAGAIAYCIYMITGLDPEKKVTQEKIANILAKGNNSVRNAYQELIKRFLIVAMPGMAV